MDNTVVRKRRLFRLFPKGIPLKIIWVANFLVTGAFMSMMILVDAFPPKLSMYILIAMGVMLVFGQVLMCVRTVSWIPRIIGIIISILYIAAFSTASYYLYSTFSVFNRIGAEQEQSTSGIDVTQDSYNVYFTGIDQWDSEKGKDLERSDVNMIATVNPVTKKVLLTSIPRDAYVPLARNGEMDKLTHTGIYGVDETINTVQNWLDIDLDFYVKINFSGVVDVINAIGGINVYSPQSFTPEKRCWYTVQKGWNHMNGKEALAFARERHQLKNGDADRVLNQQRVVKGIIRKLTTSPEILTSYTELLDVAEKDVKTNMTTGEMTDLAKSTLADMGGWTIETQSLKGTYGMETVASLSSANKYSVYKIKQSSIDECLEKMDEIMNPSEEEIQAIEEAKYKKEQKTLLSSFVKKLEFWK